MILRNFVPDHGDPCRQLGSHLRRNVRRHCLDDRPPALRYAQNLEPEPVWKLSLLAKFMQDQLLEFARCVLDDHAIHSLLAVLPIATDRSPRLRSQATAWGVPRPIIW